MLYARGGQGVKYGIDEDILKTYSSSDTEKNILRNAETLEELETYWATELRSKGYTNEEIDRMMELIEAAVLEMNNAIWG